MLSWLWCQNLLKCSFKHVQFIVYQLNSRIVKEKNYAQPTWQCTSIYSSSLYIAWFFIILFLQISQWNSTSYLSYLFCFERHIATRFLPKTDLLSSGVQNFLVLFSAEWTSNSLLAMIKWPLMTLTAYSHSFSVSVLYTGVISFKDFHFC